MNVYDSERMAGVLGADDFEITGDEKSAEYVIINTCSVRQHAEDRALSYIGAAIKDKKVIVAGCMAERMQDELMAKFPRLHAVVGTFNFSNIVSAINRGKKKIFAGITEEKYPVKLRRNEKVRGYITIMQGCDNYCAYCIVPYVRGRERSRDVEGILAEIRQLASDGFKEVMFLGQNVNSFLDAKSGINFSGLLRKSAEISGIERLRFMTSHPKDLTDELIESIAAAPKVCKHIHLPLQSGSDRILKMMNRHYTADWYLSRVRKIREAMPGGAITTDILVGFPGETDVDFQQTLEVMKKAGFDASYIFKYSPRRGTKAALMDSQVDEKEKLTRGAHAVAAALEPDVDARPVVGEVLGRNGAPADSRARDRRRDGLSAEGELVHVQQIDLHDRDDDVRHQRPRDRLRHGVSAIRDGERRADPDEFRRAPVHDGVGRRDRRGGGAGGAAGGQFSVVTTLRLAAGPAGNGGWIRRGVRAVRTGHDRADSGRTDAARGGGALAESYRHASLTGERNGHPVGGRAEQQLRDPGAHAEAHGGVRVRASRGLSRDSRRGRRRGGVRGAR